MKMIMGDITYCTVRLTLTLKASPWSWMNLTMFPRTPYSDTRHGSLWDVEVCLVLFLNIFHSREGTGAWWDGLGRLERPMELKNSFSWTLTFSVFIKEGEQRLNIKNKTLRVTHTIINWAAQSNRTHGRMEPFKQTTDHIQMARRVKIDTCELIGGDNDMTDGVWGWFHWYAN